MAKPNYSFEKRQRELAKKRKKEEKAARKTSGGAPEQNPNEAAASMPTREDAPEGGEAPPQP